MKHTLDLHMHSMYSDDGEYTPAVLAELCHEAGVKIMALADHNTVKGVQEAADACKTMGMTCIPAIEIDCRYQDIDLHLLGYGIDIHDPVFEQIEKNYHDQEVNNSILKLEYTNDRLHLPVTKEEMDAVSKNGVYTGELFAEVLLAKEELADNELLKPYRAGQKRSDNPYVNFYWDYYSQGKPCYTPMELPSLQEMIDAIHQSGGKAVLAHPGNNLKGRYEIVKEMIPLGLDGIEVFSSYHDDACIAYFKEQAENHQIIATCGSDFHGKTKPSIHIGQLADFDDEELKAGLQKLDLID